MRTTEILVVGGGCVGLASAIELAGRGSKVTLLERGLVGAANSSHHGGGIRQQFGTELNIELAKLSAATWDDFEARFGVDPLFRRIGYLFLARTAEGASMLAEHVRLQRGLGVDSEWLDAEEIARRWPVLEGRGFAGGGFRAGDGWANQHRIVEGFARGATEAGVQVPLGTEALTLEATGGRVTGVRSSGGPIAADAVLIATGPWISQLLGPLGLDLPVEGRRHELLLVEPTEPLPADLPWLIAVEDAVHVRSDDPPHAQIGGFLGEDVAVDPDRYEPWVDADWTRMVLDAAARIFGVVGPESRVHRGWAGLYPTTPDRHPIIDRLTDGLYAAVGFAGTGVMLAPGAGVLVSELIQEGAIRSANAA
ncbi:MAG TPA: FAD-dependent oxidoreductase, partial [Candidatus Limnocylindrales bacterium]|nr:FAD-dependent oxidoreductase [Candidatus Limnocylindrales bacterium]